MAARFVLRTNGPAKDRRRGPTPIVRLGCYMPFVGVRYYAILDERDAAEGGNRIGHVGWRLPARRGAPGQEVQPPTQAVA